MAALTPSTLIATEFAGKYKMVLCSVTVGSASDTIVLTQAQIGAVALVGVIGAVITAGLDAAFTMLQVAVSSLTITITSFEQDGTAATDWTGTTADVTVLAKTST